MKTIIVIIISVGILFVTLGVFHVVNLPYFASCDSFLPEEQIIQWQGENTNILEVIDGQGIEIEYDTQSCPGKIGIILYYEKSSQIQQVRGFIKSWTNINDVPYKTVNI